MKNVKVETNDNSYDVFIDSGILKDTGKIIARVHEKCACVVVTDDIVKPLYFETVKLSLEENGFSVKCFEFKNGEGSKNISTLSDLLEYCANYGLTRTDLIVALGGGVVGDLAGFAAAVYLRGIDFVQVPTTLLAAVDSSVGGKTGIDLVAGKNLAGAFHQPLTVICDPNTLKTLSKKVFADGLSESIKYAMIEDREMFEMLLNGGFIAKIENGIEKCVKIKADIVGKDEFESGLRKLLNFGHTIGHAVEKLSGFDITHGRAVAIGMACITASCEALGLCEPCIDELISLLKKNDLPYVSPYSAEAMAQAALSDKKRSGDKITLVIPKKIGKCTLHTISINEMQSFIKAGESLLQGRR